MTTAKRKNIIIAVLCVALMLSAAIASPAVALADIAIGNTYANVAAVQAKLATLGYYKSAVDGAWGKGTFL